MFSKETANTHTRLFAQQRSRANLDREDDDDAGVMCVFFLFYLFSGRMGEMVMVVVLVVVVIVRPEPWLTALVNGKRLPAAGPYRLSSHIK